jgi:hypothetical protein
MGWIPADFEVGCTGKFRKEEEGAEKEGEHERVRAYRNRRLSEKTFRNRDKAREYIIYGSLMDGESKSLMVKEILRYKGLNLIGRLAARRRHHDRQVKTVSIHKFIFNLLIWS